jgi:hypothetical protein
MKNNMCFIVQINCNFIFLIILESLYKLVVFSIILARSVTILSVVGEITRMKKICKRIILESDRECVKGLLCYTMYVFENLHVKDTIPQFLTTSI